MSTADTSVNTTTATRCIVSTAKSASGTPLDPRHFDHRKPLLHRNHRQMLPHRIRVPHRRVIDRRRHRFQGGRLRLLLRIVAVMIHKHIHHHGDRHPLALHQTSPATLSAHGTHRYRNIVWLFTSCSYGSGRNCPRPSHPTAACAPHNASVGSVHVAPL